MKSLAAIRRQLAADDPAFRRAQRGEPMLDVERWIHAIDAARAEGWHRMDALIGIDGLALVASRSIEWGDHETRVATGRVVSCTCDAGRARTPCAHQAAVALRLWETAMSADLSEVPARALALTILRQYVGQASREKRPPWTGTVAADGQPERPYEGAEPRGEFV